MKNYFSRRNFIKTSALSSAFFSLSGLKLGKNENDLPDYIEELLQTPKQKGKSVIGLKTEPIKQVRVAFIGLGNRGEDHITLVNSLCPDKAKIVAVCDVQQVKIDKCLDIINKSSSGQKPAVYTGKIDSWKEMIKRDDIDLVIISTPWEDHAPMTLACMKNGKHVACEVPIAYTLKHCWEIINTAEETQKHCMMLENVCYGDEELWLLNMAQQGVLGTLTYAECAYIHDLRELNFSKDYYYNMWRIRHNEKRDGNLYPTHGLGPVAQYMDINRGDKFETLVSMSSLQAGLTEHSKKVDSSNEFYNKSTFKHGDMNNTLIKTAKGRMILVQHDTVTGRPYNRINALAGTKGYHEGYPSRLALDPAAHKWLKDDELKNYKEKYRHPLWEKLKAGIEKYGGHGGMDFVMIYRLIDCLNNGWYLDQDVYDGVSWSSVSPLSEISIKNKNSSVSVPDFTRGKWDEYRKLGILENV